MFQKKSIKFAPFALTKLNNLKKNKYALAVMNSIKVANKITN